MLRLFVRRSDDVRYFSDDAALELEGLRDGGPGWWLRGEGDTRGARDVAGVSGVAPATQPPARSPVAQALEFERRVVTEVPDVI